MLASRVLIPGLSFLICSASNVRSFIALFEWSIISQFNFAVVASSQSECQQASPLSCVPQSLWPNVEEFVQHKWNYIRIGFQSKGEWRLKRERSGFQFPGRKHNLCVNDAARLVCKQIFLTWVSPLACHRLPRFLSELALSLLQKLW